MFVGERRRSRRLGGLPPVNTASQDTTTQRTTLDTAVQSAATRVGRRAGQERSESPTSRRVRMWGIRQTQEGLYYRLSDPDTLYPTLEELVNSLSRKVSALDTQNTRYRRRNALLETTKTILEAAKAHLEETVTSLGKKVDGLTSDLRHWRYYGLAITTTVLSATAVGLYVLNGAIEEHGSTVALGHQAT